MESEIGQPWKVVIKRTADRQLKQLPADARKLAVDLIDDLAADAPSVKGVRLREHANGFRVRFGKSFNNPGYRLLYDLYPRSRKVIILRVGSRPTIYAGVPGSGQKKIR